MCARTVRSTLVTIAFAAFVLTSPLAADPPPDPQDLQARAQEAIQDGDFTRADAVASDLENLLAAEPAWDPTGTFRDRLLPGLRERIRRLKSAEEQLARFLERISRDLQVPSPAGTPAESETHPYAAWTNARIEELRAERESILEYLGDAADRAALQRSGAFSRTRSFFDLEVPGRLAEAADTLLTRARDVDQRTDVLKHRLESIKRDSISTTEEVHRLQSALEESEELSRRLLKSLLEQSSEANLVIVPERRDAKPEGLGGAFGRLLRHRLTAWSMLPRQTAGEKAMRMSEVERYRRINDACVAHGVSTDQSEVIKALESAVEAVPLESCK